MVLVLMGCGVAVSLNCSSDCTGSMVTNAASVIGTAFAFGLAVVAMAYTIGGISGCHINPAITLGCLLSGRISGKDACGYICGQIVGDCTALGDILPGYGILAHNMVFLNRVRMFGRSSLKT